MNWRANNSEDEITISEETYAQVCKHIKEHKLSGEWTVEYFDSNQMWIEMDKIDITANTGELHIVKASHIEHF